MEGSTNMSLPEVTRTAYYWMARGIDQVIPTKEPCEDEYHAIADGEGYCPTCDEETND